MMAERAFDTRPAWQPPIIVVSDRQLGEQKEPNIVIFLADPLSERSFVLFSVIPGVLQTAWHAEGRSIVSPKLNRQPSPRAWSMNENGWSTATSSGSKTPVLLSRLLHAVKANASPWTWLQRTGPSFKPTGGRSLVWFESAESRANLSDGTSREAAWDSFALSHSFSYRLCPTWPWSQQDCSESVFRS